MAKSYEKKKNLPEALNYAKKALEVEKHNTQALFFLAGLYAKMKDFKNAITFYKNILRNIKNKNRIKWITSWVCSRNCYYSKCIRTIW